MSSLGLLRTAAVGFAVLLSLAPGAAAEPVSYEGVLAETLPAVGNVTNVDDARCVDHWAFWALAGGNITVVVARVDMDLNPVHYVYYGFHAEIGRTSDASELSGGSNLMNLADDEMAAWLSRAAASPLQ